MLAGTQKPMLGMKLNRARPLAKGLVGCWLFNEGVGNVAYDTSGYGNHGTLTNMAAPPTTASGWNPGRRGSAIVFDGINNYIDCGNDSSLNLTEAITISAWVKLSQLNNWIAIATKYNADNNYGYQMFWSNGNKFRFGVGDGSAFYDSYSNSALSLNTWYHFVGVYNKNYVMTYVNGIEQTDKHSFTGQISNTGNLLIGVERTDIPTQYLNGSIDGVKIYNRALSAEEIKWSYREPYATFERGELLL